MSDCETPETAAHEAPPSLGFSRQEHWSGLPFPSPGDLPDLGIKPRSPAFQADALTSEPPGKPLSSIKMYRGKKKKKLFRGIGFYKDNFIMIFPTDCND